MTAAPSFQRLSTVPIIAWTLNGGSTPMTDSIMLVEENAVLPAGASVVRITCTGPKPPPIAQPVMACFMVLVANSIIGRASSVKPSKRVSSVKPGTQWRPINAISAATPKVLCVTNGSSFKITSVTSNLW